MSEQAPGGCRMGEEAFPGLSPVLSPHPAPSGVSWGFLEGEIKPDSPGSPSGQGSDERRRKMRGAKSPRAVLSALLALAGCSGFLHRSLGHYARLAGLRLVVRGAGARWDAGTAAGSSPLPLLLSGLVKNKAHARMPGKQRHG